MNTPGVKFNTLGTPFNMKLVFILIK